MAGSWGGLWEKWGGRQHGEVLEMTNEGVQGGLNFAIIFSLSLEEGRSENEDGWSFWEVVFDNRLDNRRQTVIVEFLFSQTSWFHACKYHATLPGIINFTVAALPPLVLLGPCDSPPSALQCASGHVSCLEIWGAKKLH